MDTEQIQQAMRVRRAAIDVKLDLLVGRMATVRRSVPAALAVMLVVSAIAMWARRRAVRRDRPLAA